MFTHLLFCLALFLASVNGDTTTDRTFELGWSEIDITPRPGTAMAGYYSRRDATGMHDPLYAKTVVLFDGEQHVALVTLDLISTTPWMVNEARRLVTEKTGIPFEAVMIAATHSHTGPVLSNGSKRYEALGGLDEQTKSYMVQLPDRILEGVVRAKCNLQKVGLKATIGKEEKLAFNRRFFMRDGTVGWNPGKLNPNTIREAGPTDDRLPLVVAFGDKQKPLAVLANFSIHLDTIGGTEWSSDMPYSFAQSLKQVFGPELFVHYSTGCCGDVNHIDVRSKLIQKGHGEAARIGIRLAAAALRAWNDLQEVSSGAIQCERKELQLPLASITEQQVRWAEDIAQRVRTGESPAPKFLEMVEAFKILDIVDQKGEPWKGEVQVITIGDSIAWVGLPGEIFTQLGISIKEGSPFPITVISELANGSLGYIPTRQAFAQGNYEVISSRLAPGSGELLVDTALEMLRTQFKRQTRVPQAGQ